MKLLSSGRRNVVAGQLRTGSLLDVVPQLDGDPKRIGLLAEVFGRPRR